ncbi:MAG: hypothetical protein FWH02_08835 [Oscillospiraceae bacterium]|nr:hypothetical protein [Oscillospiraceae bacterium]
MAIQLHDGYGYCGIDFICELMTSFVDDEDQIRYTTYGMRVKDRQGGLLMELPDISLDKRRVDSFIETCNCGICTMHIRDVLDDFMAESGF